MDPNTAKPVDAANPSPAMRPTVSLDDRLADLDARLKALETVPATAAKPLDAATLDHMKYVLEKYFAHEKPDAKPELLAKPAAQEFEPMLNAAGQQVFDPTTGNPIFRPKAPAI